MKLFQVLSVRARRRSKQDLMKRATVYRIEVDRKETHILTISTTNGKALWYKIHTFSHRGKSITQGNLQEMGILCQASRNIFRSSANQTVELALREGHSHWERDVFLHRRLHTRQLKRHTETVARDITFSILNFNFNFRSFSQLHINETMQTIGASIFSLSVAKEPSTDLMNPIIALYPFCLV